METTTLSTYTCESLGPLFTFAKIIGLSPFILDKSRQFTFSKKTALYSFLLGFTVASLSFLGIYYDLNTEEIDSLRMKKKLSKYVTCCDIFIVIFIVLISIGNMYLQRKKFIALLGTLSEIDKFVALESVFGDKRYAIKIIFLIMCPTSALILYDLTVWEIVARGRNRNFFTINYYPFYISYLIVIGFEAQYWLIVKGIESRVIALQNALKFGISFKKPNEHLDNDVVKSVVNKLCRQRKHPDITNVLGGGQQLNLPLTSEHVSKLIYVYENICKSIELFNDIFGTSVLVVMISVILHLVATPYFLVLEILGRKSGLFLSLQILWIVMHIARMLIIIEPCDSATSQLNCVRQLVCKILSLEVEESVRIKLETFSSHLLLYTAQFTICGLFTLNRGVVTTITGTITTYLVILLQFNN